MNSKDQNRINFYKNRIYKRIDELKDTLDETKVKLYRAMVDNCNTFDDIREMAELDLQIEMYKYMQDIQNRLDEYDTSVSELNAVRDKNRRTSKLIVIAKKKKNKQKDTLELSKEDINELMGDDDAINAMAMLISMQLQNEPINETYRDQVLEEQFMRDYGTDEEDDNEGVDIYDVENLDTTSLEDSLDFDEEDDEIEDDIDIDNMDFTDDEDVEDDIDIDSIELIDDDDENEADESYENYIDIDELDIYDEDNEDYEEDEQVDTLEFDEESMESGIIFEDDKKESMKDLTAASFANIDDEDDEDDIIDLNSNVEDSAKNDLDSEIDNLIFDDEDDDDSYEDDLDNEIDSLIFEDDDIDEEDNNDEENGIDGIIFEDSDDDYEDETEDEEESGIIFDDDSLDDYDYDYDDTDELENEKSNGIDDIDIDEMDILDVEDDDNEEDNNDLYGDLDSLDIDNLVDDEDDDDIEDEDTTPVFDIDDSELMLDEHGDEDVEDDFNKLFGKNDLVTPSNSSSTQKTKNNTRENRADKIFINGSDRGRKTQDMFTMLNKFRVGAEKGIRKQASRTRNHINNSDLYKLNR